MGAIIIKGKGGINVKIIADSISENNNRITTFELEYQRFFHSEVMTHRILSKNSASSRAIPVSKMHENITKNTAHPIYWGRNQSGMRAGKELDVKNIEQSIRVWDRAKNASLIFANRLFKLGNHKQVANRITEPFQMMKVVLTGTEFKNFFYLRNHPDAQPEFKELAACMQEAMFLSVPNYLCCGEWHMPYVKSLSNGKYISYFSSDNNELSIDDALKISASCCAQASYRQLNETKEKAIEIFEMLNVGSKVNPAHASPLEHQAKVMKKAKYLDCNDWEDGVTHIDRNGNAWSGNFKGWVQHRKLIPNEALW